MFTKSYQFHNVPPFCQFYKKVVIRLSEHGDVIEKQTLRIAPQRFLANSVPVYHIACWFRSCAVLKFTQFYHSSFF